MNPFVIFIIFIPILSFILLLVNFILAPHKPYREKITPFECGYHSFLAQTRAQVTISFFLFGLLFIIFDLEIVLIYPLTVSFYLNGTYGIFVAITFILLLGVGFVYEVGYDALKISTKQENYSQLEFMNKSLEFMNKSLTSCALNTNLQPLNSCASVTGYGFAHTNLKSSVIYSFIDPNPNNFRKIILVYFVYFILNIFNNWINRFIDRLALSPNVFKNNTIICIIKLFLNKFLDIINTNSVNFSLKKFSNNIDKFICNLFTYIAYFYCRNTTFFWVFNLFLITNVFALRYYIPQDETLYKDIFILNTFLITLQLCLTFYVYLNYVICPKNNIYVKLINIVLCLLIFSSLIVIIVFLVKIIPYIVKMFGGYSQNKGSGNNNGGPSNNNGGPSNNNGGPSNNNGGPKPDDDYTYTSAKRKRKKKVNDDRDNNDSHKDTNPDENETQESKNEHQIIQDPFDQLEFAAKQTDQNRAAELEIAAKQRDKKKRRADYDKERRANQTQEQKRWTNENHRKRRQERREREREKNKKEKE